MLGIKGDGKFFSAFGDAVGLAGAAAGTIGSFNSGRKSSEDSMRARALNHAKTKLGMDDAAARAYADNAVKGGANRARQIAGGLFGATTGLIAGSAAASESKGNAMAKFMAARNAQHKSDMKKANAARNGSDTGSGLGSLVHETLHGRNAYDELDAALKADEQKIKDKELALKRASDINAFKKAIMDRVSSKALESEKVVCDFDTSKLGLTYGALGGSYRHWNSVSSAALESGVAEFDYTFKDSTGVSRTVRIKREDIKDIDISMQDAAKESYYVQAITKSDFDGDVWDNKESYEKQSGSAIEGTWGNDPTTKAAGIKAAYGDENRRINRENSELSKQREAINNRRQGYEGQKAKSDSEWGRNS